MLLDTWAYCRQIVGKDGHLYGIQGEKTKARKLILGYAFERMESLFSPVAYVLIHASER